MKALAVDEQGRVVLKEKTVPRTLEPDQIAVEVTLCFADERISECALGAEKSIWPLEGLAPYFVGWEVVGKVASVGQKVSKCRVGDVVLAFCGEYGGGCSSRVVVKEENVIVKPVKIDNATALSLFKPGLLAYAAVFYGMRVEAGDTVLVCNPLESLSWVGIQLITLLGGHVVMLARSKDEVTELEEKFCCMNGSVVCLPGMPSDESDCAAWETSVAGQLLEETDGLGFDHILESRFQGFAPSSTVNVNTHVGSYESEGANKPPSNDEFWVSLRRATLQTLGAQGTFITQDGQFQLGKAGSMRMAMCGASLSFVSEYPLLLSPSKRYRTLHMLEDLYLKLDAGKIEPKTLECVNLDEAPFKLEEVLQTRDASCHEMLIKIA